MLTRVVLCDAIHRDQDPALAVVLREQVGTVCISVVRVERDGEQEKYHALTSTRTDPSGASVDILAEVRVDLGDARTALDLLHASAERFDARLDVENVLEEARRRDDDAAGFRQTAARAGRRVDELIAQLEQAEARIHQLESETGSRNPKRQLPTGNS